MPAATRCEKAGTLEADRVIVELIGKTDGLDKPVKQSARNFEEAATRIERAGGRIETATGRGVGKAASDVSRYSGQMKRDLVDVSNFLQSPTSPFVLPAKQAPAVGMAMKGLTLAGSALGGILGGAVAVGANAAVAALFDLLKGTKSVNEEIAELIEKLKEKARQTKLAEAADIAWTNTIEGFTDALRKRNQELDKSLQTERQRAALANQKARDDLQTARRTEADLVRRIAAAEKRLADAKAALRTAASMPDNSPGVAIAARDVEQAQGQLRRLKGELQTITTAGQLANDEIEKTTIILGRLKGEDLADPVRAKFRALREEAERTIKDVDKLAARLGELTRQEDEALKKAREKPKATDADLTAFLRPVSGGTSGRFGEARGGRSHAGVDLAVPVGTSVKAPAGGVIIEAGNLPGYGNVVFIDHGRGTISRLAHLSQIGVTKGQVVETGQQVGLSGGAKGAPGSGNSEGPHVHYEVRRNGKAVNPLGGPFPTDQATAGQAAAARAIREAEREAAERRRNEEAYLNDLDALNSKILQLKEQQTGDIARQTELQFAQIELDQKAADRAVRRDQEEGKIDEAKAKELIALNAKVAEEEKALAKQRERAAQIAREDELRQRSYDYRIADLQFEDEMATSRSQHRDLQLQIVDLVFQQRIAHLETLKKQALLNGEIQKAADIQAEINRANIEHGQARTRTQRDNRSPIQVAAEDAMDISDELEDTALKGIEQFSAGITDAIMGAKSLKEVFSEMAKSIVRDLIAMIVKMMIFRALQQAFPGLKLAGGGPVEPAPGLATGGRIVGPGTGTSDSIPIMASDGEFMIRKASVDKVGAATLHYINRTGRLPRGFSAGGEVAMVRPLNRPAVAAGRIAGPGGGGPPVIFDMRGAVVTEDLLRQVNLIATTRAAQAGTAAFEASQQSVPQRLDRIQRLGQ